MNDDQTQTAAAQDKSGGDNIPAEAVDSTGTDAESGRAILRQLRDKAFDGSDEKFAVVMGRPVAEITALMIGDERVDDDIVMKARGIAQQRGVELG